MQQARLTRRWVTNGKQSFVSTVEYLIVRAAKGLNLRLPR